MNYPHGCCGTVIFTKKYGDHEIFIMKIFNHGIFSNFTKILNHENLELYGSCHPQELETYKNNVDNLLWNLGA